MTVTGDQLYIHSVEQDYLIELELELERIQYAITVRKEYEDGSIAGTE